MPDETYRIIYETAAAGASKGVDQLEARLVKLEAVIDRVDLKLKDLGSNMPGVTKALAELAKLDAELKQKVVDAGAASSVLQKVGSGNRSIGGLNQKLEATSANLKATTQAAGGAAPVLAGVGAGASGKGGGGGGGGGGGISTGLAMGGVMAAGRVLDVSAEASENQRRYLKGTGDRVAAFRDDLREYASLRGRPAPDDDILREASRFGRDAGLKPEEIRPFLTN